MKIERLTLTNFRGIREMSLEFNERLTVLAGVNGAGKSTVLDALAILLSWGVARITDPDERGKGIRPSDVSNGANYSWAGLVAENDDFRYEWSLLRRKHGFEVETREAVRGEVDFATPIRERITETNADCSVPLMVLYPVRRVVRHPLQRRGRAEGATLEAYEGALGGQANFWSFFDWFREQDDIANENRSGREWFIRHRPQIEDSFDRLTDTFVECVKQEGGGTDESSISHDSFRQRDRPLSNDPKKFFRSLYDRLADITLDASGRSLQGLIHETQYISSAAQDVEHSPQATEKWLDFIEWTLGGEPSDRIPSDNLEPGETRSFLPFIRELLAFSMEWSFWWMSRDGRRHLGDAVREGFRVHVREGVDRQDESRRLTSKIRRIIAREASGQQRALKAERRELSIVSQAIEAFVPEYTNLRISRKPEPRMLVEKDGETFDIDQLSDGEKCLIAMIGDLARRLAIANPTLENPLEGEGVALIDEIDLHLHPTWQRMVAPRLMATFPKLQFIITTHSPQVLSHVEDKSVFLLRQTGAGIDHVPLAEAYGQSYERLLEDVFGVATRPDEIQEELDDLFDLIQRNSIQKAQEKLEELRRRIGTDPELVRAGFLLHRKEEVGQ
ncbi:MAG: AAA family ATPase [Deltaproteobacteria bacterium]|nr:AAA family ATPase [Deltaproteobacteria bacterium]